jgi:hypothetical protein
LSLGRPGAEIRQVPEEAFRRFAPILHHQNDCLLLVFREGDFRLGENAGDLLLQFGERIFSGQGYSLGEQGGGQQHQPSEEDL